MTGRAIARAGLVVTMGYLASRILGWVRVAVFAAMFGASSPLDDFFAAFRIPDLLFQLVAAGALGSALIPIATELLAQGEPDRARRLVWTIANLILLVLLPLALLFELAAPVVVPAITPGFNVHEADVTVGLARIMIASPVLLAIGAVATAALNALSVFGAPTAAPLAYNLAIIAAAVVLGPALGVQGLAIGVVLGSLAHVAVQVPALLRRRFGYLFVLDHRDPAVRQTLLLLLPRALGMGATQIVFVVLTAFATGLGIGAVAVYNFAFTALQIPVGVIGVPLGIVMLPAMSQAFSIGDLARFGSLVLRSVRLVFFLILPLTGLALVLARPALAVLFQHGQLTGTDVAETVVVFDVFLVGLAAHVLIAILAPAFYAGKDTRTPVSAALVAVVLDIAAAAVLVGPFGLSGLALAIGLGAWAEAAMLLVLLERRVSALSLRPVGAAVARFVPGALAATLAAYVVAHGVEAVLGARGSTVASLVELALAGGAGGAVYVGWSALTKAEELQMTLAMARSMLGRA